MKFWQVDAFTDTPFKGNPAAVFVPETSLSAELMQKIAMEMNLSETAFVQLGKPHKIRWFTPGEEVDLCGHATVAAAHVLWETGKVAEDKIDFDSRSGMLSVIRNSDKYILDFPAQPPIDKPDYVTKVSKILGRDPVYVGSNEHDCVAVVDDAEFVRNYEPDHALICELDERGFLLTASDGNGRYIYRGFFPKLDVPEDPVTGSANTLLGPYWAQRFGVSELSAYQASRRGGHLGIRVNGDRVEISGSAVTVFEGTMRV